MQLVLDHDQNEFPLLLVEDLGAYLHWLPVTKVQFETFICDTVDPRFDKAWYDRLLALNPRLTARRLEAGNYWRAFMTGVLPEEAQLYATWCGESYSLPTITEWRIAYAALRRLPPLATGAFGELPGLSGRSRSLVEALDHASAAAAAGLGRERTLADQMLLRHGVLEWVVDQGGCWSGIGELLPAFRRVIASPEAPLTPPLATRAVRSEMFGFRLLRRAG